MIDDARAIAATFVEAACTRLELGATELAEERVRLAQQALAAIVALFCLGVGIVLAVMALAWWVGPEQRVTVLAVAAGAGLAVAVWALARWQRIVRQRPPLLQETLSQLRADARGLAAAPGRATP
jgi:uncharacterized membrane protein YqjE